MTLNIVSTAKPDYTIVDMTQKGNLDPPLNQLQEKQPQEKPQKQPAFADSSEPLFLLYQGMAEGEDKKMADQWQKSAKGVILFTGLFSASVSALLTITVQDLKQNPQDASAFYLENIYKLQVFADPNISRPFLPTTPVQPPPFSPPKYVIWVNSLWFLSLVISLTCAMLAMLLQQWAHRYLDITQRPWYSLPHRARVRAFYAHGVDNLKLSWAVEALPTMIHLSLFLFFTGLLIYFFNADHPVFFVVTLWVGLSAVAYLCITFMPIFSPETPCYTPLSSIFRLLGDETAQKAVDDMESKLHERILEWTCSRLVEDDELEKFFQMFPGFFNSDLVGDLKHLANLGSEKLSSALYHFLRRTATSNSLSISDKIRRFIIGVKAVDAARLSLPAHFIFSATPLEFLYSPEVAENLKCRDKHGYKVTNLCAHSLVARIISNVQGDDSRWRTLATDHLGAELPEFLQHSKDSVLLANLIHTTRLIFDSLEDNRDLAVASIQILPLLPEFDIRKALPELQHKFCVLWKDIEQSSTDPDGAIQILDRIQHLYSELQQDNDAAPTASTASISAHEPSPYPSYLSDHRSPVGYGTTGGPTHDLATLTIHSPAPNPTHTLTVVSSSGNDPDAPTRSTSAATSSQNTNIPSQASQDIASDGPREGVTDIPSHPILQSTLSGGASLQPNVAGSLSLNSPTESSAEEYDPIHHGPASSSSSRSTASPRVAREVAPSSGHNVTTTISSHNDTQDTNVSTQPELPRNPASQSYHSSDHSATRKS